MKGPNQKLTPEMAREVCVRTSSTAVLAGSIADTGNRYRIQLKAVNCQTGALMAKSEVQAEDQNQVVKALGDASARLRSDFGEPHASLQKFDQPLETAMTASMEALYAYMLHDLDRGDAESLHNKLRAVELDPNFALAYDELCGSSYNMGRVGLAIQSCTQAYELRDRVTLPTRFAIEERYYRKSTGELAKAGGVLAMARSHRALRQPCWYLHCIKSIGRGAGGLGGGSRARAGWFKPSLDQIPPRLCAGRR